MAVTYLSRPTHLKYQSHLDPQNKAGELSLHSFDGFSFLMPWVLSNINVPKVTPFLFSPPYVPGSCRALGLSRRTLLHINEMENAESWNWCNRKFTECEKNGTVSSSRIIFIYVALSLLGVFLLRSSKLLRRHCRTWNLIPRKFAS